MQLDYIQSGDGGIFLVTKPPITQQTQNSAILHPQAHSQLITQTIKHKPPLRQFAQESSSWFLERHLIYSKKELNAVNHIIIYMNGELVLLHNNNNSTFNLIEKKSTPAHDDSYTLLKITCHFSVSLYEALEHAIQRKMSLNEVCMELEQLRDKINTLKNNYYDYSFTVWPTIDLLLLFLDKAVHCTHPNQLQNVKELYFDAIKPSLDRYCEEAAALQLKGLHQISRGWIDTYAINLDTTYIIIVGARGPKKDLIEYQYFNGLRAHYGLKTNNKPSGGIIYSEMLPQQMSDLSIEMLTDDLARELHNMQIGLGMLHDIQAMNKDVLGQYAPPVIQELIETLPEPESKCPFHKVSTVSNNQYQFFQQQGKSKASIEREQVLDMALV